LVVAGPIHEISQRLEALRASSAIGASPPPGMGAVAAAPEPPGPRPSRVKLRVLGPPEQAAYYLRGGPGILDVELVGGVVVVSHLGGEAKVAECVAQLVRHGVGVAAVEPERNELERIFLEVTSGGRR
jgi:ABC-2 type transport system ATP-binding protein